MNRIDSQLLTLSNISLGEGYLTLSELLEYSNSDSTSVITIGKLTQLHGFSIVQIVSPVELRDALFCKVPDVILDFNKIGYRKMTAVSPEFQGMGVAKKLFVMGNKWLMKQGAEVILSAVWMKDGTSTFGELLVKQGFERLVFVKEYWKKDSLTRKFICPVCGEPPCECDAMVYAKFNV